MNASHLILLVLPLGIVACDNGGTVPENPCQTWFADVDGDGFGDSNVPVDVCSTDQQTDGLVRNDRDCDDLAPDINPDGVEVCDLAGFDEDCDGGANDADPDFVGGIETWADTDADGYGDPGSALMLFCEVPNGRSNNSFDCNDDDAFTFPGAAYEESATLCMTDSDYDGFASAVPGFGAHAGLDCDDTDGDVFPLAKEYLDDGVDQDCNGIDDWFITDDFELGVPNPRVVPRLNNTEITSDYAHSGQYSVRMPSFTNLVLKEVGTTPYDETTMRGCANMSWSFWVKRGPEAPATGATLTVQAYDGTAYDDLFEVTGNATVDEEFTLYRGTISAERAYHDNFRFRLRAGAMGEDANFYVDDVYLSCTGVDDDGDGFGKNEDCNDEDIRHWSDCGSCVDDDADGYGLLCDLGEDCDDGDALRSPGLPDRTPDGVDQNCDGLDGPAVFDDFELGYVDPETWATVQGTWDYQTTYVANGDLAIRMTGGSEGETVSINTSPCNEVAWAAKIMGRRPYYNDVLTLYWSDGQEWKTAWSKAGNYLIDPKFVWYRGIIDDPFASWVQFKARLNASGYSTTSYDYYSWFIDDFGVACDPKDLDNDGLWGGLQDCDDTSRAHWADCGLCEDADGDDFGENCDLGYDCDDDDPGVNPLAYDVFGDGVDVDCNGIDGPGLFDDFENEGVIDTAIWDTHTGYTYYDTVYVHDGDYSLRMSYNDAVAETVYMNVTPCESMEWSYWGRNGTDGMDIGDKFVMEWWDGERWNIEDNWAGTGVYDNNFVQRSGYIAGPGAIHDRFRLRFRSLSNSTVDYVRIDDLLLQCGPANADGDRYVEGEDCDDNDPNHWLDCGLCEDADGDDFGVNCDLGNDCDDSDPDINPGADEITDDGIDQNCDGFDSSLVLRDDFDSGELNADTWATETGTITVTSSYSNTPDYSIEMGGQSRLVTESMDTSSCDLMLWKVKYFREDYNALDLVDHFRLYHYDGTELVQDFYIRGIYGYQYGNSFDWDRNFEERWGVLEGDALNRDFRMELYVNSDGSGALDHIFIDDFIVGCTVDADNDGYPAPVDCDETDPDHWSDCGSCVDADGDRYGAGCDVGEDCNDSDPAINGDATETNGDGIDQNCDEFDGDILLFDDFESGELDTNKWDSTSGTYAPFVTMSYRDPPGDYSMNFWGGGRADTTPMDTSGCTSIGVKYRNKKYQYFYTSQYFRMYVGDVNGNLVQTWTMAGNSFYDYRFTDWNSSVVTQASYPDYFYSDMWMQFFHDTYVSSYPYYDLHIDNLMIGCEPLF